MFNFLSSTPSAGLRTRAAICAFDLKVPHHRTNSGKRSLAYTLRASSLGGLKMEREREREQRSL